MKYNFVAIQIKFRFLLKYRLELLNKVRNFIIKVCFFAGSEITEVCRQAVIKQMNIAIENDKTDMDSVTFEDLANEIGYFKAPSLTHVDLD